VTLAKPPAVGPSSDFAQVVYDNLLASGVQNTRKGEAIKFEWLKPQSRDLSQGLLQAEFA
jgi:hypothetical protein